MEELNYDALNSLLKVRSSFQQLGIKIYLHHTLQNSGLVASWSVTIHSCIQPKKTTVLSTVIDYKIVIVHKLQALGFVKPVLSKTL